MNFLNFFLITAIILRNVSYLDVEQAKFLRGDVVIENEVIRKIYSPFKARTNARDFTIDATNYYLLPSLIDLWIFLNGSPGGNIWVNEFMGETRQKNELALSYFGVLTIGCLGRGMESKTDLKILSLGPIVRIPSSQKITPYGLEDWNPYVFEVLNLGERKEIKVVIEKAKNSGAIGIILPLPQKGNISKEEYELVDELREELRNNSLLLFGLTYYPVENKILDIFQPDIIVGWLPDTPREDIEYEIPLFLDTLPQPPQILPYVFRLSLNVPFAFSRVGISEQSWDEVQSLTRHNMEVLKKRSYKKLLLGSSSGFSQIFFGHGTITTLKNFLKAGFSDDEVLKISIENPALFLNTSSKISAGNKANLILLGSDPTKDIDAFNNPVAIIKNGKLILPSKLEYEVDSFIPSPLIFKTPNLIVDFQKETTVFGARWREGYLSFGLEGKWLGPVLTGKKARAYDELWNRGGIISFTLGDTSAWDFSLYKGFKITIEKSNTPCSIYVLKKTAYRTTGSGGYIAPNATEITIPLPQSSAKYVQGLYIKPLALGNDDYQIVLRSLTLIESDDLPSRLITNLYKRIEYGINFGDTTILFQTRNLLDYCINFHKMEDFRYLKAYLNYRLATFLPQSHYLKGHLIDEALKLVSKESDIEMKILEYALIGLSLGMYPLKGIIYGKKINELEHRLLQEGKDNPRVFLVLGLSKLFTPPMYGGNKQMAIEYLNQSISLFKKNKYSIPYVWGYPDALIFLYEAYKKTNRKSEALVISNQLKETFPFYLYGRIKLLKEE